MIFWSGVKPEWMQVHRIINHVQYGKTQFDYLVKWRELVYEQATWERDDFEIIGYEEAINKYWLHRFIFTFIFILKIGNSSFHLPYLKSDRIIQFFYSFIG